MGRHAASATQDMHRGAGRLRELIAAPTFLEMPTVCDPLGARMAAEAGYAAVTVPGYAIGAHLPDDTLLTFRHIVGAVRRTAEGCRLPMLVDADTGWKSEPNLASALRLLAGAGAAGVLLSSQHLPAGAPFQERVERSNSHDSLVARVREAVTGDADMVITARCDIDSDDGYAAALDRARGLLAAGVDALVVCSEDSVKLERLPRDLPGVRLIYASNPPLPCQPSAYSLQRLRSWGYAAVCNKYHRCYCARMNRPAGEIDNQHVAGPR